MHWLIAIIFFFHEHPTHSMCRWWKSHAKPQRFVICKQIKSSVSRNRSHHLYAFKCICADRIRAGFFPRYQSLVFMWDYSRASGNARPKQLETIYIYLSVYRPYKANSIKIHNTHYILCTNRKPRHDYETYSKYWRLFFFCLFLTFLRVFFRSASFRSPNPKVLHWLHQMVLAFAKYPLPKIRQASTKHSSAYWMTQKDDQSSSANFPSAKW